MSETDDRQFERELAGALAAGNPAEALNALAQERRDPQRARQIAAAQRLVDDLARLGRAVAESPAPPMRGLELPASRRTWWKWALPAAAAAAAAAAVLLVVLLQQEPPPVTAPIEHMVAAPEEIRPATTWTVPPISTVSLAGEAFTIPSSDIDPARAGQGGWATPPMSLPSLSSTATDWSIPSVTITSYTERSRDNGT